MRLYFKHRWLNVLAIGLVLLVSAPVVLFVVFSRDRRPQDVRDFSAIREDWERTLYGHALEGGPGTMLADKNAKPLTEAEKAEKIARLAESCLDHADKHPNTTGELAALNLAASRGSAIEAGSKARDRLIARIATADLTQLEQALRSSRTTGPDAIVPAILDRVKLSPQHPRTAALLTFVCTTLASGSETEDPPPHYAEAAALLVSLCADSPRINNFCETLGNGNGGPRWASRFEPNLQTILQVNQDRWVQCTASMALASIAQSSVGRQDEAEDLYKQFLVDFDGQTKYPAQNVEQEYRRRAEMQLTVMKFVPIGRQAPEIVGVDLNGKPITLSEYRGKVVLLSFWATWCGPCMKLIPRERELAIRLKDQPFAIVGVNADEDSEAIAKAVATHKITWRSFRNQRNATKTISDEWNALFPTVYLIDHKGIIRQRFNGTPPPEVLTQLVDELVEAANVK